MRPKNTKLDLDYNVCQAEKYATVVLIAARVFALLAIIISVIVVAVLLIDPSAFAVTSCPSGQYFNTNLNSCQPIPNGSSLGNEFNGAYGNVPSVQSKAANPAMGGGNMSNLSGNSSVFMNGKNYTTPNNFNGQIQCPSSKSFLQILFEPTSTQDFTAVISQDPKMTGSWTYTATTPLISGVCQNGFMSCTAGTFSNCKSYYWTIASNGDVSWALDDGSVDLGQCFCTNDSCNANVFSDFNDISSVFGQGLADFVSNHLSDAISNVKATFPTITYYGQASQDCKTISMQGAGGTNPESYYSNPSAMTTDAQLSAQSATAPTPGTMPSSQNLYYDISHDEYLTTNPTTTKTCVITNTATVNQKRIWLPQFNSGSLCIGSDNGAANCYPEYSATFISWSGNTINFDSGSNGGSVIPNGSIFINSSGVWSGSGCGYFNGTSYCIEKDINNPSQIDGAGNCTGSIIFTPQSGFYGNITCSDAGSLDGSDNGNNVISLTANTQTVDSSLSDTVNNGCQSIPSNCQLYARQVCQSAGTDCVSTVSDYNNTGITPQPICQNITGGLNGEQWNACASGSAITYTGPNPPTSGTLASGSNEWWYISNTYTCPADTSGINAATDVARATAVNQNTTASSYTDSALSSETINGVTYNNGGYNTTGTTALPNMSSNYPANMSVEMCEVAASTSLSSSVNGSGQASPNGSMTGSTPSGTGSVKNNYSWLTCVNAGTASSPSWTCPLPSGDTIVTNCEVYNGMNKAVTAISVLNSMGQNIICSGG